MQRVESGRNAGSEQPTLASGVQTPGDTNGTTPGSANSREVGSVSQPVATNNNLIGLVLHGKIIGRRKIEMPPDKNGQVKAKVLYDVQCGDHTLEVAEWEPQKPHSVEEQIAMPVTVNPYIRGGKGPAYSLNKRDGKKAGTAF